MEELKYGNLPLEEIQSRIEDIRNKTHELWHNRTSLEDYYKQRKPYMEELRHLSAAQSILTPYEDIQFKDCDEFDKECVENIESFAIGCKMGCYTTDDGFGYYATKDKRSNIPAEPWAFANGYIRPDFEYVVWYGK